MDFAPGSQADTIAAAPASPRARRRLSAHPAFAPMLGLWGAGVGLAVVLVLPVALIEAVAANLSSDLPAQTARLVLAGGAALGLAVLAYGAARLLGRRHPGAAPVLAYGMGRALGRRDHRSAPMRSEPLEGIDPLDPANELGSDSFDAPLPAGLFARDSDWLPEPPADETLAAEAAAELAAVRAASMPAQAAREIAPERPLSPPCELDLAGFAALPGRNAVWVKDEEALDENWDSEAAQEPVEPNPDPALVSAIARLRAVPPAELSLCEMVERFAAALHDYQEARLVGGDTLAAPKEREAMLHEALGALGQVTNAGRGGQAAAGSGPALRARLWAEVDEVREQRGAA